MCRSARYDLRDATFDYWRSNFPGPSKTIEFGLVLVHRLVLPMLGQLDIEAVDDEIVNAVDVILCAQLRQRDARLATRALRAIVSYATEPEPAA